MVDFGQLCIVLCSNICSGPVLQDIQVAAMTNMMNDMVGPGLSDYSCIPSGLYVLPWPSTTSPCLPGYNQLLERPLWQQLTKGLLKNQQPFTKTDRVAQYFQNEIVLSPLNQIMDFRQLCIALRTKKFTPNTEPSLIAMQISHSEEEFDDFYVIGYHPPFKEKERDQKSPYFLKKLAITSVTSQNNMIDEESIFRLTFLRAQRSNQKNSKIASN